ncbi:MAG: imelysin family protein, partial [Bacteroidetes bacterium]|nr:imelysin family protein [Bacteroidota bacterium]
MRNLLFTAIILLLITSCDDGTPDTTTDFDRTDLLINLSDNIILPALNGFKTSATLVTNQVTTFNTTPDQTNLTALRNAFEEAYLKWQAAAIYEIGPADNIAYHANINTFPADADHINSLIQAGSYNLDAINNYDAKGLAALDYLLYGLGASDNDIIAFFSTDPDKEKYKQFLSDVANDILAKTNFVYDAWIGGYDVTFKSNKGNNIGSSVSILTNAFMQHFENKFRTLKIGLPAGVFSIEEQSFPEEAEAYYS